MADKLTDEIKLLFRTAIDQNDIKEVSKNIKSALENAIITFDEVEIKKEIVPVIQMLQKLFAKAEMKFDADKLLAMPSREALQKIANISVDKFQAAFDRALEKSGGVKIDFGDVDLSAMTTSLGRVEKDLERIANKIANTTKKSVSDIEESIRRLNKVETKTINSKKPVEGSTETVKTKTVVQTNKLDTTVNSIEKLFSDIDSGNKTNAAQIRKAYEKYIKTIENNDPWEVQYQAIVEYVAKFESLSVKTKARLKDLPNFEKLYESLLPKAGAAKTSLQNLVSTAKGGELAEYKNQPWARESTLKKVEQVLRNGITVKDGGKADDDTPHNADPVSQDRGNSNESGRPVASHNDGVAQDVKPKVSAEQEALELIRKRRAEAEAIAEVERKAVEERRKVEDKITKAIKERAPYEMYRAVESPEDSGKSKEDALADYGAEVWAKDKESAISYANDQRGVSSLLSAKIRPINPLVFDAQDNFWSDYDQIPGLKEFFPGLLEYMQKHDEFDTQKYIHEQAKKLGFDSVIFENVRDNLDAETDPDADITTTIAVLDDRIVSLNGSFAQLEQLAKDGSKRFSHELSNIPDYYVTSEDSDTEKYVEDLKARQVQINGAYEHVLSSFNETLREQQTSLQEAEEQLVKNPDSSLAKKHVDEAKEKVKNTQGIIAKFQQQMQYNQKALQVEIDSYNQVPVEAETPISIPKVEYNADEIQKMIEGLAVVEQKLQHLGDGASIDQSNLPDELSRYQRLIQEIASSTIVESEDDRQRLIALREEALRLANSLKNFQLNDSSVASQANAYGITEEASKALMDAEDSATKLRNELETILRLQFNEIYDALPEEEQQKLQSYGDQWNEISRNIVGGIQAEAAAHRANTEAIEDETDKQDKLNTEKTESRSSGVGSGVSATTGAAPTAAEPPKETTSRDSIQTEELRALLSSITYNVKVVQDTEPAEDNKFSIDETALENVLNRITYNVKIAHDDADKTANKIAIDEGALESTLKRVFTNILNPSTEQNDSEPKNEPWALEKTLLSVKEVLDGIHANTTKTESVEITPVNAEVGNVPATENTLAAIKTAVEAINTKIVKGTKAKTSEGGGKKTGVGKKNAESYAGSRYFPEKLKTQTMQLAKFRAQLMTTGKLTDDVDAQIYKLLNALSQVKSGPDFSEWSQKFQQLKTSVGITDIFDKAEDKEVSASYQQLIEFQKTRNKLELQYEKAQDGSALKQFYAEQLVQMDSVIAKQEEMLENEEYEAKLAKIREEQARKLGEAEAKAADKVAKKTATDQKKLDKRRAMAGKAGSAIGRAEGVWLEAEGLEQAKLPEDFKKQVSEYYDALDKLRVKHHEVNTSEVVTEEQQAELIRQTKEVNKLTEAIGPLVAEYQKLSGANVDEDKSRTSTLTGSSSLTDYEVQLKQYAKSITDGKAQIKSFNAETKTLTYTVKTGKNEFTEYTAAVRHLDNQLVSVQGTTKRTETFFEATARKMRELTSYFSGMAIFNRVGQELRRGIQYVREIDDALVELRKVTDETDESYDKFLRTAAKTGAVIGATISEVTEATATFSKLGYDMEMATEMAESAIVYKNVGDNIASAEDAADSIISTLKGFRLESSETMRIVDRFNEVGKSIAHVI